MAIKAVEAEPACVVAVTAVVWRLSLSAGRVSGMCVMPLIGDMGVTTTGDASGEMG